MALEDLLERLEQRVFVTPVTSTPIARVTGKPAYLQACTQITPATPRTDKGRSKYCKQRSSPSMSGSTASNDDFAERVAILIEGGGHDPATAHQLAIQELGGDTLVRWWTQIEPLSGRIAFAASSFLKTPLAAMAAYYGWNDLEIFGVLNGPRQALVRRHDTMGLIPALAWSRIGARLVALEENRATIEAASGNLLNWQRRLLGQRSSVPVWWSCLVNHNQRRKYDE